MKKIRYFRKSKSVFARFQMDTPLIIKKCYEHDMRLLKLHKFMQDPVDMKRVKKVIRKYYHKLKAQFHVLIANVKSYPGIQWFDFVNECKNWNVLDQNVIISHVDRIFLATNYDEWNFEMNPSNALNRFEFIEIFVRLAKIKYAKNGIPPKHLYKATDKMLKEHIIPGIKMKMQLQPFREDRLWTLPIDNLIRANMRGIHEVYRRFASEGLSIIKIFIKEDAFALLNKVAALRPDVFHKKPSELQHDVILAFSMSQMTIVNESVDQKRYYHLQKVEFYEFIGRWAELTFPGQMPLDIKYEKMLLILLPLVGFHLRQFVEEEDVSSESDCDDEIVENVITKSLLH